MTIFTERRRWWIAGSTLTICLSILIWGPKPSLQDPDHPSGVIKEKMTPSDGDTRNERVEKPVGQP